jgi:hypothetical protein
VKEKEEEKEEKEYACVCFALVGGQEYVLHTLPFENQKEKEKDGVVPLLLHYVCLLCFVLFFVFGFALVFVFVWFLFLVLLMLRFLI